MPARGAPPRVLLTEASAVGPRGTSSPPPLDVSTVHLQWQAYLLPHNDDEACLFICVVAELKAFVANLSPQYGWPPSHAKQVQFVVR